MTLPNAFRFLMKKPSWKGLHLYIIGKACNLSKWVPHILSNLVSHCFVGTVKYPYLIGWPRMRKSGYFMRAPKCYRHWLPSRDSSPRTKIPALHPRKIMLCEELVNDTLWSATNWSKTHCGILSAEIGTCATVIEAKESALVNQKSVLFLYDNAGLHVKVAKDTIRRRLIESVPSTLLQGPTDYHILNSMDYDCSVKSFAK